MGAVIEPYNVDAEMAVLGILIEQPARIDASGVTMGDFTPAMGHDVLFAAMQSLYEAKGICEWPLLLQELAEREWLGRVGGKGPSHVGPYLAELIERGRSAISLPHYARLVRAATVRRRLWEIGTRLTKSAESQADPDVLLDQASQNAVDLALMVDQPLDGEAPIPGFGPMRDFLDEPSPPHSWVIPGLLERADRLLLVAGEGVGKSVLARQTAVLLACGRHPFQPKAEIPAKRVMIVDLENPPALMRRNVKMIDNVAQSLGLDFGDRLVRWNRPQGIDLRSPGGRALFTSAVERARPDLICVGPLYKMSEAKPHDTYEVAAAETAHAIDLIRERYGCAFMIEHHMPKGSGDGRRTDPIGSSFWLRWPEFGRVLTRAEGEESGIYEFAKFRGDRDERLWPQVLYKGASRWPWTAEWNPEDALELDRLIEQECS